MRAFARVLPLSASLAMPAGAAADEALAPVRKPVLVDVLATGFVGDGLRFDNPYRLATVLGSSAQSLSRTAGYADVGGAVVVGDPTRAANGVALRVSIALEGVSQSVLTPSYLLLHRAGAWGAYARVGVPVTLSPDTTWGLEAGGGGLWFARAGVGIAAELVGDVFYGAGTRDVAHPAYPVLSAQAGLWLSWEAIL